MKKILANFLILCTFALQGQVEVNTLEYLKNNSTEIVVAKPISFKSYKKDGNRTYTDIVVEIKNSLKGNFKVNDHITLTYYGGEIDGITTAVLEDPSFRINEESVLFLTKRFSKTSPIIYYYILENTLGKFNIFYDEKSYTKKVVRERYTKPLLISKHATRKLFEKNQPINLDEFIRLIK